jgi:hypothetical protein
VLKIYAVVPRSFAIIASFSFCVGPGRLDFDIIDHAHT